MQGIEIKRGVTRTHTHTNHIDYLGLFKTRYTIGFANKILNRFGPHVVKIDFKF